ncbi:uncharacterized protein LAESUDRAFT_367510 [Laetiporus sulphureus 93-53]|uniref:Uncharacterized protein n=1 Tax=Laetiporus sulphureus 93-53 TaxID=1314785 RepID=A0A165CT40_9APHY|nr:uncharacterized protein LAESUDRAFT_367510 [Laetiporus sulphureus 93-53]KZT03390.1 hypothetical protein LAESUDRAFT_367510 [Laetiporus sulphureus 93-53]
MKQQNLHRSYARRRLVPQPAYRVPPGFRRFTVPITDRVQYISFWFEEGAPYGGFHMASLYEEEISVADPHDAVFLGSGITEIDFRIKWPAYPYAEYHRILQLHGRGHMAMTREQLARYVTVSYREFINEHRDRPVEGDVAWAFQPQGDVDFQDLWLLGLRYVTENTYQAEVLYEPRQ